MSSFPEAYEDLLEKLCVECTKAMHISADEVEASVAAAKRKAEATKKEIRDWEAKSISAINEKAAELIANVDKITNGYSTDCLLEKCELDGIARMTLTKLPEGMSACVLINKVIKLNTFIERVKKANKDAARILSGSIDFHFVQQLTPIKDCVNECTVKHKKIYKKSPSLHYDDDSDNDDDDDDDDEANNMRITIKDIYGGVNVIETSPKETIDSIMKKTQDMTGIPICQQRLICNGRQLVKDRTLADYNIQDGSVIHLVLKLIGEKPVVLLYPPEGVTVRDLAVSVCLAPEFFITAVYPEADVSSAKTVTWDVSKVGSDGSVTLSRAAQKRFAHLFWEFSGNHTSPIIGLPAIFGDVASTMHTDGAHAGEFLAELLDALGMTPRERDDMVTYWLHAVQGAQHLLIRVVRQRDLERCAALSVTPKDPSTCPVEVAIHRIYLLLHPCDTLDTLDPALAAKMVTVPCIPANVKDEFPIVRDPAKLNVVEWGGVILN